MAKIVAMSSRRSAPYQPVRQGMSSFEKTQLAVQVAALVRAHARKPTPRESRDVLHMAGNLLSEER